MSLRRSSRLNKTGEDQQEAADLAHQSIAPQPRQSNKRKIAISDPDPGAKSAKRTTKTKQAASKKKQNHGQSSTVYNIDRLSDLPPEIFSMVLNNMKEKSALSRLSRTCKKYYSLITPFLYRRIAVAAMFHAHIGKLIRTLEPHLSIQQRKQLKKEGTYKGQKDVYPSNLRPQEKPVCADYVRQLVIGSVQAGKKHDYIVHRYVEETLKNTDNIEVFEALSLTQSMAETIAGFKKLQALSLDLGYHSYHSLHNIKNLKHLALRAYSQTDLLQSLLLKSRSTLRSLDLSANSVEFFNDWTRIINPEEVTDNQHYFTSLNTLSMQVSELDLASIRSLTRAIDFVGLRELNIKHLRHNSPLLFHGLADLFSKANTSGLEIRLQSLKVNMAVSGYNVTESEKEAATEAKSRFLSSFDTLKVLELEDYGQYPLEISENPGLPNSLVRAILQHKRLEKLGISYKGIVSGFQLPYLTPATVATLIDNLPLLREINISPEEHDLDELGKVLSRASNIELIEFSCTDSWASHRRSDDPTKPLLHSVLKGFLSRNSSGGADQFSWEDNCKLRRVIVNCQMYEIASKFGKGGKGISKPEKFKLPDFPKREVMFRNITGTSPVMLHVGFDPTFSWVEKVSKDLD
ncbi:rnilike protein [Fusarium sporotrichioides]|uniref:Rnilike protein n=1 Tax=Fusarium sporotrichioides TaxID=5514 RepID=A0A395RL49_FUSSP|nr:rnilike protein [Fusarium sporotrichioides]